MRGPQSSQTQMNRISRTNETLFRDFCESHGVPFRQDVNLATFTTFRTGGPAKFLAEPETEEQARMLQSFLIKSELPYFLLGGGSNILIADEGFPGVVVRVCLPERIECLKEDPDSSSFEITASSRTGYVSKTISRMGYTGLEYLSTIPGSVGGAVVQNAGCYGYELKDSIVKVRVLRNGETLDLSNDSCEFSYRNSLFKRESGYWILSAIITLPKGSPEVIQERLETFKQNRLKSQPKNRRSAGSVFKNPSGSKAWQLIERAGLRGKRIGGAVVSPKHCNFIVNDGSATSKDIYELSRLVKEQVQVKTGVNLEYEIIFLGFDSERA